MSSSAPDRIPWVATAIGISSSGSGLHTVAMMSYLVARTETPLSVSGAIVAAYLPSALVLPIAGVLLDRFPRRAVVMVIQLLQALAVAALVGEVHWGAPVVAIYATIVLLGILGALVLAALMAWIPQLASPERRLRANAHVATGSQLGVMIGMSMFALINGARTELVLAYDAATFLVAAGLLAVATRGVAPPALRRRRFFAELSEGFGLLRRRPDVRVLVLLAPTGSINVAVLNTIIPILALSVLGLGQRGYAITEVAYPVTAIVSGLVIARLDRDSRAAAIRGFIVATAGFLVLAGSVGLFTLVAGMMLCANASITMKSANGELLQRFVPDELQGRVQSFAQGFGALVACGATFTVGVFASIGYARLGILLGAGAWFAATVVAVRALPRTATP